MRIIVYVEGPSDKAAMEALLLPLLEKKRTEGVAVVFFEAPPGDKKESVLTKVPRKAANILLNDPHAVVVAMPDLYPKNRAFPHETVEELERGIFNNFHAALLGKEAPDDFHAKNRFKVFCFKHDMEVLILASHEALRSRLGAKHLTPTWRNPVEDQDHNHPPKRIVEELFNKFGQHYRDTVDAPMILSVVNYQEVADRCPQCFKPFIEFLSTLKGTVP
ncbi:DUF4276 family protein [Candidatus Poribacteria bacterium]|nr:DUF4276 family protein [Candidatus Poribacteria bacterium]